MSFRPKFSKFRKKRFQRPKVQTNEERIKEFITRNSRNGFFTRVQTIVSRFELPENQVWDIVGALLADSAIESMHDAKTGEMKLCEFGKTYQILRESGKRRRESNRKETPRRKNTKEN